MVEYITELAAKVTSRYSAAARAQIRVINEMEQCRLYYRGDQWLKLVNNQYRPAPQPKHRVRLTINKLIPIVELSIATFLRYRPIIIATPATDEEIDRKQAKVAEMMLRYYWEDLDFDTMLIGALLWTFVCGSAFVRASWDNTKGKPLVDIISPFSMSVEPGATKFNDAGWCIITEILRTSELEQRFNTKITPDLPHEFTSLHMPMLLERDPSVENEERAALHQMYERPTAENPQGRLVYVANEKVVGDVEELPNGQIRIEHLKGISLPGELWPTSQVSQMVDPQTELNRGISQLTENRNLCARPQILAAEGCIEKGAFKSKPGTIVPWNPIMAHNIEPKYMMPPVIPGWVMMLLNRANEDMMDLSSRHEASQGISRNQTSGRQTALFRSADDSRLAPQIRVFERSLEKIGRFLLSYSQEKMEGEHVLRIIGRNREAEIFAFNAQDINDQANVRYEIASQLPWARESMRQYIIQLNAAGKMDDETMFKLLELPTIQKLYEHEQEHRLNARNENNLLDSGYFPPLPTDNDRIHLQEHEKHINLPENRKALAIEMQMQEQMAEVGMELAADQSTGVKIKYPQSLENRLRHVEDHRNRIPKPQPPPPATKVNLNLDRVLQNPVIMSNPAIMNHLIPLLLDLVKDSAGEIATPSTPPERGSSKARAPGMGGPLQSDMYGTGAQAALGLTATEGEMLGGIGAGRG